MIRRLCPALLLLGVAILAYGLLIPQLGFYWDELPMTWIRYELGPAAMTRYFSTNRPVWGLLYQATTRLLPQVPVYWQVFALFWRWLSAVLVWAIVRALWPERRVLALTASALFLVYPGFNQQWTAYLYSHFFLVLCFLLGSFLCMLWSFRHSWKSWHAWLLAGAALLLSALNLWMLEYFFVLELLRPFLIFRSLSVADSNVAQGLRLRRTVRLWLPYLGVFIANVLWRLFVFNNQIYQPTLLSSMRTAPVPALWQLMRTVVGNLYTVGVGAWAQALHFPSPSFGGPRTIVFYVAVVIATAFVSGFCYLYQNLEKGIHPRRFWPMGLALVAMTFAGGPFWLAGLDVSLAYPASRFTLPFMLGVSLALAGLLELLPVRPRILLAVLLIGLAAGRQELWADAFRRDWVTQKAMFWQMAWRIPGLQPGTTIMLNQGPLQFYADNSLTGALNWIYDPGNRSGAMDYVLFFPTSRLGGSLQGLVANQSITYDFISEVFTGNTSQTVAMYYAPPGCLRVLDPVIDTDNHLISEDSMMREAATLSSSQWILAGRTPRMPGIYGPEPAHGWCYYFEQAQLAAQMGSWSRVVQLGDKAFQLNDYPNDPLERFVFIEGYARTGNWERAKALAVESYKVSSQYVGPLLCKLFTRMDTEFAQQGTDRSSLNELRTKFSCLP